MNFDDFNFDPETLELTRSGEPVHLAMQPARLLRLLLQRRGQLVGRNDIRRALWPDKIVDFEQSINATVRQLRRALGDDADTPRYVETLPRRGYRFVLSSGERRRGRRIAIAAAGLAFASVGVALLTLLGSDAGEPGRDIAGDAFEHYQKGVYLTGQGDRDARARGIEFLERSVAADPLYADAWAALAGAWMDFPDLPADTIPPSRRAAERALELEPEHPVALRQLANAYFLYDWDWPAARALYERALAIAPDDADVHQAFASFLYVIGEPERAERHLDRVEALDPVSSLLYGDRSWYLMVQGRFDEALEDCGKLAEIAPEDPMTTGCPLRIYVESRDFDAAATVARKVLAANGAPDDWFERLDGETGIDAIRAFDELRHDAMGCGVLTGHRVALTCALVNADLGRIDAALMHLQQAIEQRDLMLPFIALYPEFRTMHDSPEFQALVARVGLPGGSTSHARKPVTAAPSTT